MQTDSNLVINWRPNVVYLVGVPRASDRALSGLSPASIKLEAWLKFNQIPFYVGINFTCIYIVKISIEISIYVFYCIVNII
jgi:hypothetical protein